MDMQQIKRGDSFEWLFADNVEGGLEGITITAAVRTTGRAVRSLTVEEVDLAAGEYQVSASAEETENWPTGYLPCDLKYSSGGVVGHSETFNIYVTERITP